MGNYILVVLHKLDHTFGYYDVATGKQVALMKTRPFPHEVCLSPDRKKIYIAEMGVRGVESNGPGGHTIAVYATRTRELISTIDTVQYDRPHGVATHSNGRLFVTSESTKHLLIYDVNTEKLLHAVFLDQDYAHIVNVSHDGKIAYTANIGSNTITAVDTVQGMVIQHFPVLERPEGMAFSPDGQLIYVVCRESQAVAIVDVARREMIDKIETDPGPVRVVISPNGKRLTIPLFHSDAIQIADTTTRKVTHTIPVGRYPAGTTLSPDGKLVFIACEVENKVYVFSMDTLEIIQEINTNNGCDAMVSLNATEIK